LELALAGHNIIYWLKQIVQPIKKPVRTLSMHPWQTP
jgi:hypothetical protein